VTSGVYNVLLGNGTTKLKGTLTPGLFSAENDYWLEVAVNGEAMTPRIKMTSVAFSLRSQDSSTVGGKSANELEFTNNKAIAAMGAKSINNSYNHSRYTKADVTSYERYNSYSYWADYSFRK